MSECEYGVMSECECGVMSECGYVVGAGAMLPVSVSVHLKEQLEALETDMTKHFAQNKAGELAAIQPTIL